MPCAGPRKCRGRRRYLKLGPREEVGPEERCRTTGEVVGARMYLPNANAKGQRIRPSPFSRYAMLVDGAAGWLSAGIGRVEEALCLGSRRPLLVSPQGRRLMDRHVIGLTTLDDMLWSSFEACLMYPSKNVGEMISLVMMPATRPASEFHETRSPTRNLPPTVSSLRKQ